MHHFRAAIGDVPLHVVQARIGHSLVATFNAVHDLEKEDGRLESSALVVRMPVDEHHARAMFGQEPGDPQGAARLDLLGGADPGDPAATFARVRDRAVYVLSSEGGEHWLSGNVNPLFPYDPLAETGIDMDMALGNLREAEMDHLVEKSRALLSSPPQSLFRAPSGKLVRHFLRVGSMQCDRDAIDAIAFWLLPRLRRCAAVVTDTWSISSIAYNAAGLAARYFGGPPRRVEMLPDYHDGSQEASDRATAVIQRLVDDCEDHDTAHDQVLVLISATQTGSLVGNLENVFPALVRRLEPNFVALFALGKTDLPALRDLSGDEQYRFHADESESPSEPVEIDRKLYFPLQYRDIPIEIGKKEAEKNRQFFDRYARTGLVTVHRDDGRGPGAGRHHGVHLDVARIVDHPDFRMGLDNALAGLGPQVLVVAGPHAAARALASAVMAALAKRGQVPPLLIHPNLFFGGRLTDDQERVRRDIVGAGTEAEILVLDDVCVGEGPLSEYQKNLRTLRFRGKTNYLIGIERMPHAADFDAFARRLGHSVGRASNTVLTVERVPMPDLRKRECPWCCEQRLYDRWALRARLPDHLARRREFLAGAAADGLSSGIFLTADERGVLKLGERSFYVIEDSTEADAYASASAALQELRSAATMTRPRLGRRRYPVATVLRHQDYLTEKWTDSILRATLLRAASADELVWTARETEAARTAALRDLALNPSAGEHDVAFEILLAAGLGKATLPLDDPEVQGVLTSRPGGDVAGYMLDRLRAGD